MLAKVIQGKLAHSSIETSCKMHYESSIFALTTSTSFVAQAHNMVALQYSQGTQNLWIRMITDCHTKRRGGRLLVLFIINFSPSANCRGVV